MMMAGTVLRHFHTLFNSTGESRSIPDFAGLDEEVKQDGRKPLDDSVLFLEWKEQKHTTEMIKHFN